MVLVKPGIQLDEKNYYMAKYKTFVENQSINQPINQTTFVELANGRLRRPSKGFM